MADVNVLYRGPRPTKSDLLSAIQEIIQTISVGLTDQDLADRLGCHRVTISNARNMKSELAAHTLLMIGVEFGPEALQPYVELCNGVVINIDDHDEDTGLRDVTKETARFTAEVINIDDFNHTHKRPIRDALKRLRTKINRYLEQTCERRAERRSARLLRRAA